MNKTVSLLAITLVIFNLALCYKLWKNKEVTSTVDGNETLKELKNILASDLENSDLKINPFQNARTEKDTVFRTLFELLDQPKLCFYYNELSCGVCTEREIIKLDSLSKIIGQEKIIILTKFSSFKNVYLLRRVNKNFKFPVVFIDNIFDIPISHYPTNFYFLLDNEFRTKLFFVPFKLNLNINEIYYSRVIDYFKSPADQS